MKLLVVLSIALGVLLGSCSPGTQQHDGVHQDGHYREQVGTLVYLMRFHPDGRVVLINGTTAIEDGLPALLTHDAKGDPSMGWYNVAMRQVGDSMFFTTHPEKGEIDYRGTVMNDSTVRFERYSHINGDRRIKEYTFRPDERTSR